MIGGELAGRLHDARIDEIDRLALGAARIQIDHRQAFGDAHLNRGKPDAVLGIHGLDHVGHEAAQPGIDLRDGFGDQLQPRIGRLDEFEQSHGRRK